MSAFIRKGDFWSGMTLVALGAYIVKEAWSWEYLTVDGPGPGFFPLWYGGAMIVLSLLLVAGAVLKSDPAAPQKHVNWSELRRVLTCWAAFVACIALLNVLGFVVSFAASRMSNPCRYSRATDPTTSSQCNHPLAMQRVHAD